MGLILSDDVIDDMIKNISHKSGLEKLGLRITNLKSVITGYDNPFLKSVNLREYLESLSSDNINIIDNTNLHIIDKIMNEFLFNDDSYKNKEMYFDIMDKLYKILEAVDIKPVDYKFSKENYDFYFYKNNVKNEYVILKYPYENGGSVISKGVILFTGEDMLAIKELMSISKERKNKLWDFVKKHNPISNFIKRALNKENFTTTNNEKFDNTNHLDLIDKFKIFDREEAIYKSINNFYDIETKVSEIINEIKKINIDSFLENISDIDTKESLRLMNKIVEKYISKIEVISKIENTDDLITIDDIRKVFRKKLIKITKIYFLQKVITSIYKGLEANIEYEVYKSILKRVNKYLSFLGIKTYNNIKLKEDIDSYLDFIEILTTEGTENKDLNGKVYEIVSYPYIFEDDILVLDGSIIVYKLEK